MLSPRRAALGIDIPPQFRLTVPPVVVRSPVMVTLPLMSTPLLVMEIYTDPSALPRHKVPAGRPLMVFPPVRTPPTKTASSPLCRRSVLGSASAPPATGSIGRNTRAARFVGENRISKRLHSCKHLRECFFIFVNRISTSFCAISTLFSQK